MSSLSVTPSSPTSDVPIVESPTHESLHAKEKHHEEVSRSHISKYSFFNFGLCFIGWCIYIGFSAKNYANVQQNPVTSVSYVNRESETMPAVTICNWNSQFGHCDYCDLTLISCLKIDPITTLPMDCSFQFNKTQYILNITANGFFRCYQFNNNPLNVLTTNLTGYSGSYAVVFGVNMTAGFSDPTVRYGIQTTFNHSGNIPDVFAETNFSPVGLDTFYSIQKEEHRDLNGNLLTEVWTTTTSVTKLPYRFDNRTGVPLALVGVSFGYANLQAREVTQLYTRTANSYTGELGAMTAALLTMDAKKFIIALLVWPYAIFVEKCAYNIMWETIR